ncbi:MAG: glutamine synthetase [Trueperaceae bacterium]|nr:glutamine synthetase [Trueperaceae bacterium]
MEMNSRLEQAGVKFLRILWCDNANVIRAKAAHISQLDDSFEGIGISAAQQALPVMYDAVATQSGLGPVGEALLKPDWSTLQILPYAPGHAQVIGDMLWESEPWEHCPRAYLREQLAHLANQGYTLNAAFENEFFLLKKVENGYEPADKTIYAATSSMNQHRDLILELCDALEKQGLEPEFYYAESGPGQQELSTRYREGMAAADQQIVFRETARGVAQNHGLVASFLPKILESAAGSGCHINLSLWQKDRNVMPDGTHPTGISETGRQFMAGIMHHLPALCALTIPSHNSYKRIRPHFWAGAYRSWGYGNREASLRVTKGSNGASRFEVKTADATANPYLALSAIIAAGLDGLAKGLELPPEVTVDPGHLALAERERLGASLLPQNLGEALEALANDSIILNSLGEARAKAYRAVRQMEWEALKDYSLEDEVKLLAERY